jgi:biotin carboxyl carrier protein
VKFQVEIADRVRTVEVVRQADGYAITIDGTPRLVEAVRVGAAGWSLVVDPGRRSAEAVVVSHNGSEMMEVHIDGLIIPVHLRNIASRRAAGGAGAKSTGPQRVTAPMPGKIVRVLVTPGEEVKTRQGLVVVEAMKMENELRASREGRVRDVFVSEGQSVEAGTELVVVD